MIKVAFFDTHNFDKEAFDRVNSKSELEFHYFDVNLNEKTALLASGYDVACIFVEDKADQAVIDELKKVGVKLIALRSAGYNHVDFEYAKSQGLKVARVPNYSPHAIAEHTIALILSLNRKIHRAYNRVRDLNFSLEGFVGFDLCNKSIGVLGTGKIGIEFCKIMKGFQCQVRAFDLYPSEELIKLGVNYVSLDELFEESDIISLHMPLTPETYHIINQKRIDQMKRGVMIVNTSRGGLVDTSALIEGLKSKKIGTAGLDVYEEEEGVFFRDFSEKGVLDDQLARLLTFPNVIVTSHQAFLTIEALNEIAKVTLENILTFRKSEDSPNFL